MRKFSSDIFLRLGTFYVCDLKKTSSQYVIIILLRVICQIVWLMNAEKAADLMEISQNKLLILYC